MRKDALGETAVPQMKNEGYVDRRVLEMEAAGRRKRERSRRWINKKRKTRNEGYVVRRVLEV